MELFAGSYAQTWGYRWGDYSAMQVDPIDDCTFWYTTEYAGRFGPGTRIDAFRLPGCAPADTFALEAQPADVPAAQARPFSLEGTAPAFQGYALGQIEVVAAGQPRSGCSSTGVPGGALLMVLVAAALRRRRSSRSRRGAI